MHDSKPQIIEHAALLVHRTLEDFAKMKCRKEKINNPMVVTMSDMIVEMHVK